MYKHVSNFSFKLFWINVSDFSQKQTFLKKTLLITLSLPSGKTVTDTSFCSESLDHESGDINRYTFLSRWPVKK